MVLPTQNLFTGFSTASGDTPASWTLYDIALVNQDITNQFNTRLGERVMRPTFGCSIWNYFMEPLIDSTREQIAAEAVRVCQCDSRVVVQNVTITALDSGVRVAILLSYQPYGVVATFSVDFEATELTAITAT